MKTEIYSNLTATKNGYRDQLIYYYNKGLGKISEIAGVIITKELISTIEKRYQQLGGILPIKQVDINAKKDVSWKELCL